MSLACLRLDGMTRTALVLLVFFFGATPSYAQHILGTVSTNDGEAITLANIVVLNTTLGTITDESGAFKLEVGSGSFELAVSAIGFATDVQRVEVATQDVRLNITLTERTEALGDIVVTAQKIEENIIDAPLSVSILSTETVEETRTWNLAQLTGIVPNYLYQELGVGFQQIQAIRGIQVFSENPAIATYVDGVNALDILGNGFQLTDIERIEVLRGPQGTLFGRNAMGGVVNIITKAPSNQRSGFAEASFGNLGLQRYALGIKTPIVENKLFASATGLLSTQDGFLENDTTGTFFPAPDAAGSQVGEETSYYGNVSLKWIPSASFSTNLNVKAQQNKSDASGFFVGAPDEVTAMDNPDSIFLSRVGTHEHNLFNTALSLNYVGNGFQLASISTYQQIGFVFEDIDSGGVYSSYNNGEVGEATDPQQVFSQEFRVSSVGQQTRLKYTAGIYLFNQIGFEPTTNLAFLTGVDEFAIFRNKGENAGFAAFGQGTLALGDQFDLTAGLRFDSESRENTFNGFGDAVFSNGTESILRPDTTVSGDYTALSPKVALTYRPNETSSLYASFTRGFRAGGINAQRLPDGIETKFDPEYSDNFELGYKGTLAQNRLYLSATAFLINWTDLQFFNLVGPFTFARENVGDASSLGVEIELRAIPVQNLQVEAALGFNETEYDSFALSRLDPSTFSEVQTEIGGNRLSNAPQSTLYLAGQYSIPVRQDIDIILRGELRNIGSFYTDIQNDLEQEAYSVLNTRIGITTKRLDAFFWVQNLADERYLVYGSPDTSFNRKVRVAQPRTLGITLIARY